MNEYLLIIGVTYLVISLLFTPIQYKYLKAVKTERESEKGLNYEEKSFGEQYLHFNAQSSPFLILANVFAWIIIKMKK